MDDRVESMACRYCNAFSSICACVWIVTCSRKNKNKNIVNACSVNRAIIDVKKIDYDMSHLVASTDVPVVLCFGDSNT